MSEQRGQVEVTVLGSGTSHGVPMIGCDCTVCTSDDPRDKRMRPSIFVRTSGHRILVDTSPELRLQCLAHEVTTVDAVLFTHHHADHVGGLDDLRRFNWMTKQSMPCYGTARTLDRIRKMFAYAFQHAPGSPHSRPNLDLQVVETEPFTVGDQTVIPIPIMHGPLPILGYRIGNFAYCTDCSHIPDESIEKLRGLDVFMVDAVRRRPHPAHFSLDQAIDVSQRVNAKQTYFTHLAHAFLHAETNAELPERMALAYDGLRIATG